MSARHTDTHTSCSDTFRLFVLFLIVQPGARTEFHREREAKKQTKNNKRQRGIINKHTQKDCPNFCCELFFFHGDKFSSGFVCSLEIKLKSKELPICFHRGALIWIISRKPSECFRHKYFLWMCLRGSAHCRKKTKVGAVYFLHSRVCVCLFEKEKKQCCTVFVDEREFAYICVWASRGCETWTRMCLFTHVPYVSRRSPTWQQPHDSQIRHFWCFSLQSPGFLPQTECLSRVEAPRDPACRISCEMGGWLMVLE